MRSEGSGTVSFAEVEAFRECLGVTDRQTNRQHFVQGRVLGEHLVQQSWRVGGENGQHRGCDLTRVTAPGLRPTGGCHPPGCRPLASF